MNSLVKHLLHCTLFIIVIIAFEILGGSIESVDPWTKYGRVATILLYLLRSVTVLTLPQVLFNFCGLVFYNAFSENVKLNGSSILVPYICLRVVTRGDFPDLVKANVLRNMNTCLDTGAKNLFIEVVTDKAVNLPHHPLIREIVVPKEYKTRTGALFKSRALQYCLEDYVNMLNDNDWIVHLDEETLLTEHSVRGIINFVLKGKHKFGQGLITYANENVVNWWTTLADSFRVADDMGKLRLQFKLFHRPLFGWKGSYVVTQLKAERQVSFDNGLDGSVAEDCFFAMRAFSEGFTFDFIEGQMYEKSPFTLHDFLQQRKRWLQGILLVVHSKMIPIKYKLLLGISIYSWVTLPLSTSNLIFAGLYPIPCPLIVDLVCAFIAAVNIYMYIFGIVKSLSLYPIGVVKSMACVLGVVFTIPFNIVIENIAVIWGVLGKKHKFYVVQKEVRILEAV